MKPVVSSNQVNLYLWRKQGFELRQQRAVHAIVGETIGLYGTAPTCYLSLLARGPKFRFEDLDEELYQRRRLARMRCMRGSLFILPKELLPAAFQATKREGQGGFRHLVEKSGVSIAEYRRTADHICQLLDTQCMTVSELKKALSWKNAVVEQALNFIVALICAEGRLIRARVRGGWKSDLCEYTRFENWLPDVDLESIDPDQAAVVLARHYFDTFGPATAEDFRWWSGLGKPEAEAALRDLTKELVEVEVRGLAGPYWVLRKNLARLRSSTDDGPEGVSLLPVWDGYLMAYKNRERYVAERWYDRVYDKGGNATSTVLLHGRTVGIWDMEEEKQRLTIKVALFDKFSKAVWREL